MWLEVSVRLSCARRINDVIKPRAKDLRLSSLSLTQSCIAHLQRCTTRPLAIKPSLMYGYLFQVYASLVNMELPPGTFHTRVMAA